MQHNPMCAFINASNHWSVGLQLALASNILRLTNMNYCSTLCSCARCALASSPSAVDDLSVSHGDGS